MQLPDFIVLGVAKSGTTTLFKLLQQHPGIYLPHFKEVHFFDDDKNWVKGTVWYKEIFTPLIQGQLCGDISPGYFERQELVIPRLRKTLGACKPPKLIVILRNPVERAYSHWYFQKCYYGMEQSFEQVVDERLAGEDQSYTDFCFVADGLYSARLKAWTEFAGRDQIKVVLSDDFTKNTRGVTRDICAFLGLDEQFPYQKVPNANTSSEPKSRAFMNLLSSPPPILRKIVNAVFNENLKRDLRQKLYELNARRTKKPALDEATRSKLVAFYRSDIEKTSVLLGRNLSHWLIG